jgi:hypothetical protein
MAMESTSPRRTYFKMALAVESLGLIQASTPMEGAKETY